MAAHIPYTSADMPELTINCLLFVTDFAALSLIIESHFATASSVLPHCGLPRKSPN